MPEELHPLATTLSEIGRDIASLRAPDLMLESITRRVRLLLGTDVAYLSLNDLERSETYIRSTDGVRSPAYRSIRMPLGTGVLGLAAGGVIAETPDYLPDEGKTHLPGVDRAVQDEGVRAILGVPLRSAGRVIGALMVANRYPGRFTPWQREWLESLGSLAAAALELVVAKDAESNALAAAEAAEWRLAALQRSSSERADLESRLGIVLADGRGLEAILTVAAETTHSAVRLIDRSGSELLAVQPSDCEGTGRTGLDCAETLADLIGEAAPGAVGVQPLTEGGREEVAGVTARYASIALLYERTIDDARNLHETDLVAALLAPPTGRDGPAASTASIRRALGADGPITVAVLSPSTSEEGVRRQLLARIRGLNRSGTTLVAAYENHVVVIDRGCDVGGLDRRIRPHAGDVEWFGGLSAASDFRGIRTAHTTARGIATAMRALGRQGVLADPASAGIAGFMLQRDDDHARGFLDKHLGPLLGTPRGEALLRTALAFLDADGVTAEAAQRLGIHPNTVRQRLERLDVVLAADWRTGTRRLDTHVALRLWQLSTLGE